MDINRICRNCKHDSTCVSISNGFCWEPIEEEKEVSDNVNHPKHYNIFNVETIDLISSALTHEEFLGYLKGNILKYRLRAGWKLDRDEDLAKSNNYQDILNKVQEEI